MCAQATQTLWAGRIVKKSRNPGMAATSAVPMPARRSQKDASAQNARVVLRKALVLSSEHLTARGYLRTRREHGIQISQLNAENDG
jgi:hypothetical protein